MRMICFILFMAFGFLNPVLGEEYHTSDSLFRAQLKLPALLKSNRAVEKAQLLNGLYAPGYVAKLKSTSTKFSLDSIVESRWSEELQSLEKRSLLTCTFEDEGKTVLVDILVWNAGEAKWEKGSHNYYWFNDEGRLREVEFQEYVSPEYKLYTRIEYEYDGDLLQYESKYDRVDEIEAWSKVEQFEYVYNEDETLKRLDPREWDTLENDWVTHKYSAFSYNAQKIRTKELGYNYDHFENLSEKTFERRFESDSLGQVLEVTEFIPGWENGNFVPDKKQENTYDAQSLLGSESFYRYDYDADDWLGLRRWEYVHAPANSALHEIEGFEWNTSTSNWELSSLAQFFSEEQYDTSAIENWDFLAMYASVYAFGQQVSDWIENHSYANDNWQTTGHSRYYFSQKWPVGNKPLAMAHVAVYPNPATSYVQLKTNAHKKTRVRIRNSSGQVVLQTQFTHQHTLQIASLAAGLYLLELQQDNSPLYHIKLIKH